MTSFTLTRVTKYRLMAQKSLFTKATAENSLNLGNKMDIQVLKAFRTPNRYDQKRTPRHIKLPKMQSKARIAKVVRETSDHLQ